MGNKRAMLLIATIYTRNPRSLSLSRPSSEKERLRGTCLRLERIEITSRRAINHRGESRGFVAAEEARVVN